MAKRHGMYGTPTYQSWVAMKARCYKEGASNYKYYGGRGITVCDKWHEFIGFFADMGERPSRGHFIERVDSGGNYEPSNCKWATKQEQVNNVRSNVNITHDGITDTQTGWERRLGFSEGTVKRRILRGMDPIEAITTPLRADFRSFTVTDKNGNFIGTWNKQSECSKDLGLNRRSIGQVLQGLRNHTYGYTMEYV